MAGEQEQRLEDLMTELGTDYKSFMNFLFGPVVGGIQGLNTTDKSSFLAAINEVKASASGAPPDATTVVKGVVLLASLADMATGTDVNKVATVAGVRQERSALKAELLGGADAAWDTLQELKAYLDSDENADYANLLAMIGTKANSTDVYLKTETYSKAEIDNMLGDPNTDLVALYTAAKQ